MSTATSAPRASSETSELLSTLARDGYCVMKSVIPPHEVASVRESVAEAVRRHSSLPPPQGYATGFLRVNQSIAPYLAHPRLMAIVDHFFGEFPRISMLTGAINAQGIKRGEVHADWPFNQNSKSRIRAPYPDAVLNLVTMWMLTDYTEENGGTIVIPGSHKRDFAPRHGSEYDPMASYEGEVQLVGKAGDVGIFDARTWHAIAPNRSDHARVGVIVRYAPWWINLQPLRPGTRDRKQIVEDNDGRDPKVEALPLSVYEKLPADVQPLVYHMVDENA